MWDRNSETNIAGYRLYHGTVPRVYTSVVNAGNATTASVSNLAPGVTHRFAVTAFNTSGAESDYSSEISFTTTNGVTTNVPPTLTSIADRTVNQNTATGPIGFVIGDAETPAAGLGLSASSSNPSLVPNQNIVFGGSGSSRTVNVTPATDQTGATTISITVSDGSLTATDSFVLTVSSAPTTNEPPALSSVRSTTIFSSGYSLPIRFSISDAETPAEALQVSAVSSNPNLIPVGNITFQGSGSDRTLTVRAANAVGSATITLSVNDGSNTVSANFGVSVLARPAQLVYLPFEAEGGAIVAPMQLYTDSSTTYVASPSGNQGTVSFQVSVTQPGNYIIWARHLSPDNGRDSFFVSVDGVEISYATAIGTWSSDWQWTRVTVPGSPSTQDPRVLNLSAGTHTVTFRGAEPNCGLDRIVICNDLEYIPGVGANTAPNISSFSGRTVNEDTSTGPIAFTVSDAETPGSLAINTASSNPSLVPSANVTIGGTGTSRTLTVTPALNQSGTATVTVTVSDGQLSASSSFVLTVNAVNDVPTIAALPAATVPLNIPTVLQPVAIGDVDTAASSLVVTGTSSDTNVLPNANIVLGTVGLSRTLSVHPLQTGTATVTVRVSDGLAQSAQSFLLTVTNVVTPNNPPTLGSLANLTINEDAGAQTVLLSGISSGGENQTLTVTASATPPSLIPSVETVYVSPRTTGTVSFVTAPNMSGSGTVTVTVSDGLAQTARSFAVTVNAVNDAPTLTSIANSTTVEDTATAPIAFTIGDAETATASLTLSGASSDLTLVPNANIVFGGSGSSRTVRVTPAANQFGTASISVSVSDGTLSASRTFQLTVTSSNDAPTIAALPAATVPLNIPTALQPVVIADIDTAASSLVVTGTSSDTNVLPNANILLGTVGLSRTLSVHPLQPGTATVTVRVSDGLAQSTQSFLLTVTNIVTPNNPPTLASLANLTINEDAGARTVLLSGISSGGENQTLTVTASATPPSLIPSVETVYVSPRTTGTVSFVTAPNMSGSGTVTVTVSDGLAQTVRSFVVTVNPVNDAPTLTSIANSTTVEDTPTAPISFTIEDAETAAASLTLSATSSDATLVPNANIVFGGSGANRTVRVTPAANQFGTASINVSTSDGNLSATRTFQLTVTSSNDAPTITSIANSTIVEDAATAPSSFTIGDVETPATSLTLSATSSDVTLVPNANIVFGGSGANRTVRVTPAANRFGTASISVLVSDGAVSSTRTFQLTVTSSNDPPTIAALPSATAIPDTLTALQPVVIADIDTAESSLVVTGTSSDTNVLPNANIIVGTVGPSRTLSVRPLQAGTATVTLRVNDGVAQSAQSFLLTATNGAGQFALRPSFDVTNGGFRISWDSRVGYIYRVLTKTSLTQTTWIPLINIRATNTTTSWTDSTAGRQGLNVYRIEMSAPIGF